MDAPGPDPLSPSKGDFVDPCLGYLISALRLPEWLKGLLAFMMKPLVRTQGVEGWAPLGSFPLPLASSSSQPPPYLTLSPPLMLFHLQPTCVLRGMLTWGLWGRTEGGGLGGLKIIATPGLNSH